MLIIVNSFNCSHFDVAITVKDCLDILDDQKEGG